MSSLKLARIEQNQAHNSKSNTLLEPDFSHRLSPLSNGTNTSGLSDTIDSMALRANSVLTLLSNQFTEDGRSQNNEQIYYALQSVIQDIADIRAVVSAFHKATKKHQA